MAKADSITAQAEQQKPSVDADDKKTELINVSADDDIGVSMDVKRTDRFYKAMSRLHRSIHSLEAIGPLMKGLDIGIGRPDPAETIRAFSAAMNLDIDLLFQMMTNEEPAEVDHD
jgi:hypothetical protein